MPTRDAPSFRELDRAECDAILQNNHVGRIAFSFHDRVDIQPIHYVRDGAWVYVRTDPGNKLSTLAHNRWVAFEVDEIDGLFDWRSVVVRGSAYSIDPDGTADDREAHRHAVSLLRQLIPRTLRSGDPVPFRDIIVRIHVDEVSGRAASTGGG